MLDLLLFGQKTAPDFFWDMRGGVLPAGATFTRASAGWSFNSAGVLTSASSNVARFDYDPVTLQPLGYLAEMQSTNGIVRSQALTGASWAATSLTVTDNAQTSPDGTADASTIVAPAAASAHLVADATSFAATLNSVYGGSFFAKNISGSMWVQISIAGSFFMNVNPATGAIGSTSANISSTNARQLANGWWRFSCFFTSDATATKAVAVGLVQAANSVYQQSFTGDGTSTVAVFGVQVETAGVGVTSYIPTAGSTVTRAQDVLSLPLTSLSGWNAGRGGVLLPTYRLHTLVPSTPGYNQTPLYANDGSTNNMIFVAANQGGIGVRRSSVNSGGVEQFALGVGVSSPAVFTRTKQVFGWGTARGQLAVDGALSATASGTYLLPVGMTTLNIGMYAGGHTLNGTIESIAYYAGARSDGFVQAVSR